MKPMKPVLYVFIMSFICVLMFLQGTANAAPAITSPTPGSTLSGSSETFYWNAGGTSVTAWWLWAGDCDSDLYGGCGDSYYSSGTIASSTLTDTASNLPTDGSTVYVRLWYYTGGNWQSVLFEYAAYDGGTTTGTVVVRWAQSAAYAWDEIDNYVAIARCEEGEVATGGGCSVHDEGPFPGISMFHAIKHFGPEFGTTSPPLGWACGAVGIEHPDHSAKVFRINAWVLCLK